MTEPTYTQFYTQVNFPFQNETKPENAEKCLICWDTFSEEKQQESNSSSHPFGMHSEFF